MKIAVIPARGGSKRIPRKNIKEFLGLPMIAWAINHARESKIFDHIVVSTDDDEIRSIAKKYLADYVIDRPSCLADDHTPTVPVIAHAVSWVNDHVGLVKYACCIYPCSPLISVADLISADIQIAMSRADFVYPVVKYSHPIQRAMNKSVEGKMKFIMPKHELTRTQDLEATYHDAGQFYFGRAAAWIAEKRMHTDGIGIEIPSWRVVDIDTEDDWVRAEKLSHYILA
jgi:pseudaminic acid cytidylyltransferase